MNRHTLKRIVIARPKLRNGAILGLLAFLVAIASIAIAPLGYSLPLSGVAVAIYGTMILASRDDLGHPFLAAACLVTLSVTHPLWLGVICYKLFGPGILSSTLQYEIATMIAITGVVFTIVISLITSSKISWLAMFIGTLGATAPALAFELMLASDEAALGWGVGVLHLTITGTLVTTTIQSLWSKFDLNACRECGYDLGSIATMTCPECGWDAIKWASHAK